MFWVSCFEFLLVSPGSLIQNIFYCFFSCFSFEFTADKVTESLTTLIKKVSPGNVAPVTGVRKAMGVAPVPPQQISSNSYATHYVSTISSHNQSELVPIYLLFSTIFYIYVAKVIVKKCD